MRDGIISAGTFATKEKWSGIRNPTEEINDNADITIEYLEMILVRLDEMLII